MAITYTASQLLDSIRSLGTLNNEKAQSNGDDDLLKFINEVVRGKIVPQIMRVQQEYLVHTVQITVQAGVTKYRIPIRGVGQQLRDFTFIDAAGNRRFLGSSPIAREDLPLYNGQGGSAPAGFLLEGPYIRLVPITGNYQGKLEFAFFLAPSELVLETAVRKVAAVDTGTGLVTLDSDVPAGWTAASLFDIHAPWAGAELKVFDASASQVGGTGVEDEITFSTAINGSAFGSEIPVEVGDYVCLAGQSAILQIPEDLVPLVIEAAVTRAMVATGDSQGITVSSARTKEQAQDSLQVLSQRLRSKPMKLGLRRSILFKGRP